MRRHVMDMPSHSATLWVYCGLGGRGSCRFPLENLEMLESLRLLKNRLSNDNWEYSNENFDAYCR